jgi:hypothetical protein
VNGLKRTRALEQDEEAPKENTLKRQKISRMEETKDSKLFWNMFYIRHQCRLQSVNSMYNVIIIYNSNYKYKYNTKLTNGFHSIGV